MSVADDCAHWYWILTRLSLQTNHDVMPDSMLMLRAAEQVVAEEGFEASYELWFGEDRFRAVVDDGRFEISRGNADGPDATVEADSDTLAALIYAGRPLDEAVESGDLKIEGDRAAFERFLGLFPLPEPAPPAGV